MKTKKTPAPKRAGTKSNRIAREVRVAKKLMQMSADDPAGLAVILGRFPELSTVF